MNCGLHRISSNVERIVRPGLTPPRGACPGHVRLSAVSNPQSCREMLNHWSCPPPWGADSGPPRATGNSMRRPLDTRPVCHPPWVHTGPLPSACRPGNRLCVADLLCLTVQRPHAVDSSRLHRLNPLGPRVFPRLGSVHKWMCWLASAFRPCQTSGRVIWWALP